MRSEREKMLLKFIVIVFIALCGSIFSPLSYGSESKNNIEIDILPTPGNEQVAIIFIHGVMGDAKTTFKSDSNILSWPEMLAIDPTLGAKLRVLSLAYQSGPLQQTSNIHEIATRLSSRIIDKGVFKHASKVIFITHSMGGLVARHILLQINRDRPEDYAKIAGLFFLATPSGGSEVAKLTTWMSRNPQFNDMSPVEFNTFLQAEEDDWAALQRKRNIDAPYPKTYCIYEKLPVGPTVIVPRNRAQIGCDERPIAFDRNHIDLVKPANRSDEIYQYVAARIQRLIADEDVPLRLNIQLIDRLGISFPVGASLRTGDQYAISISVSRPAWLYVFGEDSRGKNERYFPSKHGGSQSEPMRTLRIPSDIGMMLTLDEHIGIERLTIIASIIRRPDLDNMLNEIGTVDTSSTPSLQTYMEKRGSIIAPAKNVVSPIKPQHLQTDASQSDIIGWLTFFHSP